MDAFMIKFNSHQSDNAINITTDLDSTLVDKVKQQILNGENKTEIHICNNTSINEIIRFVNELVIQLTEDTGIEWHFDRVNKLSWGKVINNSDLSVSKIQYYIISS